MSPAVLFLVFKRPDTTALVFDAIRQAQPSKLYVAADGPRTAGDVESCTKVRQIASIVDWPCELQTFFRSTHVGCREAVSSAIDWFFEHENEGIILEDDCLPSQDFFCFCRELLPRFRSQSRVMSLCGSCFTRSTFDAKESYYFSYYSDIWGWATWRRAWRFYDRDLATWPAYKMSGGLGAFFKNAPWREAYWTHFFDRTAAREIDTWDYQWIYTVIRQKGLACYPTRNLICNIGFGPDATFTKRKPDLLPHQPLYVPLRHPNDIQRSELLERELDAWRLNLKES